MKKITFKGKTEKITAPSSQAEKRAVRLFAARPRVQQAAVGNPRRINAILARLETEESE